MPLEKLPLEKLPLEKLPLEKLTDPEIESRLASLPHWTLRPNGKIARHLQFTNFIEAFGFLAQLAIVVEGVNHHPEIYNVYNKVGLELVTHDAGGLTAADFDLASQINEIASRMGH